MAAKFLSVGTPNPRVTLLALPTPKLLYSTSIHPQPTKISAFSVRARGRFDNSKLLSSDVWKRPIDAIDFNGRRFTIGDVASKDSFKSNQAKKSLQALAADTNDRLQVWDDGAFHKYLALKLFSVKIQSLLEKGKIAVAYLMRASFSLSFEASNTARTIVAVLKAIIWGINNRYRASIEIDNIKSASIYLSREEFIDRVFSYVFGDGDPNKGIEEKRWKMIGLYIALNGSVVTAEEIAPYLDMETTGKNDESYMLPVLHQFDGQQKVDEEGNILYHFPSVPCTPLPRTNREKEYAGRWVDQGIKVDKFLEEHQWKFSKLDDEALDFVASTLRDNLLCAVLSGFVLRETIGSGSFFSQYLFDPLLLMYAIYAVSFKVISSIRWSSIKKRNAEIVKRNEAREERAKSLESPDFFLMQKLLSARTMARMASIGNDRIVSSRSTDH